MAKSWLMDLYGDFLKLNEHLKNDHNDELCLEWINKCYTNLAKRACKLPKCRTRGDTKNEIKNNILESFGKGNQDTIHQIDTSTEQKCLQSMKHLIGLINKSKVERMYYIYQQGKVISALKKLAPKGCELGCYLHLRGIKYSDSYCCQLVLIHDLNDTHQNLLKC